MKTPGPFRDAAASRRDVGGLVAAASLHGRRSLEKPSRRAHPALLASAEEPDRMTTITMNDGIEIYRKDWGPGTHVVLGHGCRSAPIDRKCVDEGTREAVRVDFGGRRIIKKKTAPRIRKP